MSWYYLFEQTQYKRKIHKNMRRFLLAFLLVVSVASVSVGQSSSSQDNGYKPLEGFVPDKETAAKTAEAIWVPIYGKEKIEKEKPFRATLNKGVWTVEGTLPAGLVGGVALVKIAKDDGRIFQVLHGQ